VISCVRLYIISPTYSAPQKKFSSMHSSAGNQHPSQYSLPAYPTCSLYQIFFFSPLFKIVGMPFHEYRVRENCWKCIFKVTTPLKCTNQKNFDLEFMHLLIWFSVYVLWNPTKVSVFDRNLFWNKHGID